LSYIFRGLVVTLVLLCFAFAHFSSNNTAHAATGIFHQINFQGKLVNTNGTNVTDGSYSIVFSIYTVASGGSNIWTETQSVTVTNGIFQVNLGSVTTLPGSVDFNTDNIFLGMKVGADAEMTPRIQFTAVPQAFNSEKLGGLLSSAFAQLAATQTFTGTNTFQPTTNISSVKILQNSSGSFGQDVFLVQGSSGGSNNFIQVTSTAANAGAVTIQSLGANALTLQSGSGTISLGSTTAVSASGAISFSSGGTTQTLSLTTPASTSAATGAISIISGNATVGSNLAAGGITIDTGSATGSGAAALQVGATNAKTVVIGNTANTTSITLNNTAAGGVVIPNLNGTSTSSVPVCRNSSNQLSVCDSTNTTGRALMQGGNTFSAAIQEGTLDNNDFTLFTNGSSNVRLRVAAGGNVGIGTSSNAGALLGVGGSTGNFQVNTNGSITVAQAAVAGGQTSLQVTPGAHTAMTAEVADINSVGHTDTITGAYATQRFNLFGQSTITAGSAFNITDAATVAIAGAPKATVSATITNSSALLIQSGAVTAATNSYGLNVNAQTGATNNYAAIFQGGNVGIGLTAPTAALHVTNSQPASVGSGNGTAAGTVLTVLGATGGNTTDATATAHTGGTGSSYSLTAGAGGDAASGSNATGGNAGTVSLTAGNGGAGVTTNGAGGAVSLTAGNGGANASGAKAAGGAVTIQGGNASTSGTGNANGGTLTLDSGVLQGAGTSTINIGTSNASAVHIGRAASTFQLDSNTLDVSTLGAITGATGLVSSGTIQFSTLSTNGVLHTSAANGTLAVSAVLLGSEVSGTLPVGNGGTGATSFTTNGVLYGNNTGAIQATGASTGTQCLITASAGVAPTWGSCSSGVATTLQNAYDNSSSPATITSSSAAKTILLQSGATFNTTSFLEVKANGVAAPVLSVDTANQRVGIGTATPAYALDVVTSINASVDLRVGGVVMCDSTGCSASPGGGNYIRNATAQQTSANFNIKSNVAGQITGVLEGSNSATVPVTVIRNGTSPGAGADLLQLQDSSSNVLAKFANTGILTLGRAGAGTTGAIVLNNGTNSNAVTLTTGTTGGNYNLVLPTSAGSSGDCLKNGGTGGTLTFAACGSTGITTTLQNAYDNSSSPATITTSAAAKGVGIIAGAVPTADLLSITNAGQANITSDVNALGINYVGGAAAVEAAATRINLTPGGTTGGTWSGLRVIQNVTGPATGVTSNGAKFEGPATTGGAGTYNAINIANIGTVASGGIVRGINITGTNSQGAGTVRGIQLNNLTAGAASEIGIDLGTGWDSLVTYNNNAKVIINGTGFVQAAAGGTNLDTSGSTGVPSISAGTWSVSATLAATLGGTGQSSYAIGDLLTGDTGNTLSKIAAVATGQCLISQGVTTKPIWGSCTSLTATNGLNIASNQVGLGGTLANSTTTITSGGTSSQLQLTSGANIPAVDQLVIDNTGSTGVTTGGVSAIQINYKGGAAAVESSAQRIDLQPGGTTGGTWNGLRVVQNVTGPATGVTSNGAKFEGPATTGGAGTYNAINIANIGTVASGGIVRGINITGTNSQAAGTVRGIQLNNLTAGAASEIGIDLGTGWDSLLTYNNGATVIINGSGMLQTAAGGTNLNTSGSTGVPSISAGTWSVSATLAATLGGTGQSSYAVGDLLIGDTGNTLSKIAAVATGSCLISQGVTTKPIWGACSSISLGAYSTSNTDAHGATLSAGVLTFQDASATAPGMVGTGTQTFIGTKTFSTAATAGGATTLAVAPGAHTGVTTEVNNVNIQGNTETITGAVATQRFSLFGQNTITAGSALAVTDTATVAIAGAPKATVSATITNSSALLIQAGAVTATTNSYGLNVNAQSGATNNYAAVFNGGNVGIGTATPGNILSVAGTSTANSGAYSLTANTLTVSPSSAPGAGTSYIAVQGTATSSSANLNANTLIYGNYGLSQNTGTATLGAATGVLGAAVNTAGGIITSAYGLSGIVQNTGAGSITTAYTLFANSPTVSAGSIGTADGVFIGPQKISGVTTGYGVYQAGTSDLNYFAGNVGVGIAVPTATLHVTNPKPGIVAGTGTNSTAPLTIAGGDGGDTSGTTGQTAGNAGSITITAGNGGNAPGGSTNGFGGNIFLQAGTAGSGAGSSGLNGGVVINGNGIGSVGINGAVAFGFGTAVHGTTTFDGAQLFKNSANSTSAFQVQNSAGNNVFVVDTLTNSNQGRIVLGKVSTNTGAIAFAQSGGANLVTLQAATQTVGAATLTIPDLAGVAQTVCTTNGTTSNCPPAAGSGNYIQNQNAGPQATANFNISGAGTIGTSLIVAGHSALGPNATIDQNSIGQDNSSIAALEVVNARETSTTTSAIGAGYFDITNNSATGNTNGVRGVTAAGRSASGNTQNFTQLMGAIGIGSHNGTGTATQAIGLQGSASNNSTGTVTSAVGVVGKVFGNGASGTISQALGFYSQIVQTAGTVTTGYGFYGDNPTGTIGTYYAAALLGGNVGVGTATPTALLHVSGAGGGASLFRVTDTTATSQNVLDIADGGATTLRNQTNSTAAFQVQSAAAGTDVLTVDTTNSKLTVRGINSSASAGSSIVTSQDFTNATFWTTCNGGAGGWTGTTTTATHNTGNTTTCTATASNFTVTNGATYEVTFTLAGNTSDVNTIKGAIGSVSSQGFGQTGTNTQRFVVTATSTTGLTFTPTTNFNGVISNISVKLVTLANTVLAVSNSNASVGIEVRSGGASADNTYIGLQSGRVSSSSSQQNTGLGSGALASNEDGSFNTALGAYALTLNVTGSENTAVGNTALYRTSTGMDNTSVGYGTLYANTTGRNNVGLGAYGLSFASTASDNTAIGFQGLYNSTGGQNTAVGSNAGNSNITGTNNTYLGYFAGYTDPTVSFSTLTALQNATAIGYGSQVQASNSLILGGQGANQANVGIGTTSPTNFLSVSPYNSTFTAGTASVTSGLSAVTGSGTAWTTAMIGDEIIFSDGTKYKVSAVGSTTTLTIATTASATETAQTFRIQTPALQVTSAGLVGIGTTTPAANLQVTTQTNTATAFDIQNSSNTSQFVVSTTGSGNIVTIPALTTVGQGAINIGGVNNTNAVGINLNQVNNSGIGLKFTAGANVIGIQGTFAGGGGLNGKYIDLQESTANGAGANTNGANLISLVRNQTVTGGSLTEQGDILTISNQCSGACTDTSSLINLNQQFTTASGTVLKVSSAGTGNLLQVIDSTATAANVFTIADGGVSTFKSQTNNTAAVQVQNASGNQVLTVDTSSNSAQGQVVLGKASTNNGTLVFSNSAGANTATLALQANPGSSYTLLLPTTGPAVSQCLQSDSVTASQLKFASCASGIDLQTAYNNTATTPATITTTATNKGLLLKAGSGFDSTSLFQVQNAAGTGVLIGVDSTADASNLITNGSAELNTTGWTARTGCTLSRDTTSAYRGTSSVLCTNAATANAGMNYPVTVTASTNYEYSFYVRAPSTSFSTFSFGYAPDGATETNIVASGKTVSTVWGKVTGSFSWSPISGTPYFFFKDTAGGHDFEIDGFKMEASPSSIANPYQEGKLRVDAVITSPLVMRSYSDTVDAVAVYKATGGEVFQVNTSNGSVGINTSAAAYNLDVKGSLGARVQTTTDNTTAFQVQNTAGTALMTADTTNLKLDTLGDVNIGTVSGTTLVSDGFESGSLATNWTATETVGAGTIAIDTTHVRTGVDAVKVSTANTTSADVNKTVTATSYIHTRGYYYFASAPTGNQNLISLYNNTSGYGASETAVFYGSGSGKIGLWRVASGTSVDTTASLPTNRWFQVDLYLTIGSGTTGAAQVYVDGQQVLNLTGTNTGSPQIDRVVFGQKATNGGTGTYWMDDVYADAGASTGSASVNVTNNLQVSESIATQGNFLQQSTTNSTTAFQVQNSAGVALLTVDTTNQRVKVGTTGTAAGQLYVSGTIPAAQTGSVATTAQPWSIYHSGNYVYSVSNSTKLEIYDVTNPASPSQLVSFAITGVCGTNSVVVSGHYAYVSDACAAKFYIIDVSNPKAPSLTNTVTTSSSGNYNVIVQGRYAYVFLAASVTNGGAFQIFDVSNPASVPAALSTTIPAGAVSNQTGNMEAMVVGKYLYDLPNQGAGAVSRLYIYDISNPASPSLSNAGGTLLCPSACGSGTTNPYSNPEGPVIVGHYAYIFEYSDNPTLDVWDVKDPSAPVKAGAVNLSSVTGSNSNSPEMVTVQGRYAYVTNFQAGKVDVVDISTPTSPSLIGSISTNSGPIAMTVAGRYAYIESYSGGNIQAFDIGGTYTQSLETGSLIAGNIESTGLATFDNDINVASSATIGAQLQVNGTLAVGGSATIVGNLQIGSATTDTTQVNLQLDSFSTRTDTGTCNATTNQGAMYYNSNSQDVRTCSGAAGWASVVTTDELGLLMFGVVPDSGTDQGDLISTGGTAHVSGPCKVSWATATSVAVAPCTAYSGGRKVIVASATLSTTNTTINNFQHVCLSGTDGQPALTTSAAEAAGFPTWSITAPVLCLADVDFAAGNNTISHVYDTRTFTTSSKEYYTSAAALGLGYPACPTGAQVTTCALGAGDAVVGVVAATNGNTSSTTPNVIIVTAGPTNAKAALTGVVAADVVGTSAATANRLTATIATNGVLGVNFDSNLGISRNASPGTACTTTANATNCDYQLFFIQQKR